MGLIDIKNVKVIYDITNENNEIIDKKIVLNNVSLSIDEGDFICILGKNGSGKSTLAKLMNALILPTEGNVISTNLNTKDNDNIINIRKNIGMVFQNPDNQIVGTIVEEDIAFGLENIGIETNTIKTRVDAVLNKLNINNLRKMSPNRLSGGQKQKISIAGILAMEPKVIVLDEPTSMLDPSAREELMNELSILNKNGITIVLITHFIDEIFNSNKVVVMCEGEIKIIDTPNNIIKHRKEIKNYGISMPIKYKLLDEIDKKNIKIDEKILDV